MEACPLCDPRLGPVIAESAHWRLVLNRNQHLLGKCFLVARRHLEAVPNLSPKEWLDLHRQLVGATRTLAHAFHPDHVNDAFLGNQDRHLHLYLIPRYAGPRTFAGTVFADPDYPDHYAVSAPARSLAAPQSMALARHLRQLAADMSAEPTRGAPTSTKNP